MHDDHLSWKVTMYHGWCLGIMEDNYIAWMITLYQVIIVHEGLGGGGVPPVDLVKRDPTVALAIANLGRIITNSFCSEQEVEVLIGVH